MILRKPRYSPRIRFKERPCGCLHHNEELSEVDALAHPHMRKEWQVFKLTHRLEASLLGYVFEHMHGAIEARDSNWRKEKDLGLGLVRCGVGELGELGSGVWGLGSGRLEGWSWSRSRSWELELVIDVGFGIVGFGIWLLAVGSFDFDWHFQTNNAARQTSPPRNAPTSFLPHPPSCKKVPPGTGVLAAPRGQRVWQRKSAQRRGL